MNIDSLSIPDLPKNAFHQAFFNFIGKTAAGALLN